MQNILLALNVAPVESSINSHFANSSEYRVVDNTVFADGIIQKLQEKNIDVVITIDNLTGFEQNNKADSVLQHMKKIREVSPKTRIVLISQIKDPNFYYNLVSLGIYDFIIIQNRLKIGEIIKLVENPKTFADVSDFYNFKVVKKEAEDIQVEEEKREIPEPLPDKIPNKSEGREKLKEIGETLAEEKEQKQFFPAFNLFKKNADDEKLKPEKKREKVKTEKEIIKRKNAFKAEKASVEKEKPEKPKGSIFNFVKNTKNTETVRINKVIGYFGLTEGLGTTTIAYQEAERLSENYRVLYVEFSVYPSLSVFLDIGDNQHGIDKALINIENAITDRENIISDITPSGFNKNLDFMFFSKEFIYDIPVYLNAKKYDKENLPYSNISQIINELMAMGSYDFIIFDGLKLNDTKDTVLKQFRFCHEINIVLRQDPANIIYTIDKMDKLNKSGVKNAANYIINYFDPKNRELSVRNIEEMLKTSNLKVNEMRTRE